MSMTTRMVMITGTITTIMVRGILTMITRIRTTMSMSRTNTVRQVQRA
jgi:hypothetical protein